MCSVFSLLFWLEVRAVWHLLIWHLLLIKLVAALVSLGFLLSIYLVGWQTLGGRAYEFIQWITLAIAIIILVISIVMIWRDESWYGINFSLLVFPLTFIIAQFCIFIIKKLE